MFSKIRDRLRVLVIALLREKAEPRQVGLAVGVGTFVGCTPAVGFHGGLAVLVATILGLNRVYTFAGSRVSNILTGPPIVFAQIQVAHFLRTGRFLELSIDAIAARGFDLIVDWMIGLFPVGGALSVAMGLLAFVWARSRKRAQPVSSA